LERLRLEVEEEQVGMAVYHTDQQVYARGARHDVERHGSLDEHAPEDQRAGVADEKQVDRRGEERRGGGRSETRAQLPDHSGEEEEDRGRARLRSGEDTEQDEGVRRVREPDAAEQWREHEVDQHAREQER